MQLGMSNVFWEGGTIGAGAITKLWVVYIDRIDG
jgi:hypothetical protein